MIEVNKCVRWPQVFLKFFAGNHLTGVLQQHRKDLKWLFLEAHLHAVLAQFTRSKIRLENTKTEAPV